MIKLDEFQKKAIAYIEKGYSLVVSAPTGAGKTLIAEYVIKKCIAQNKGIIYTAPIKALSNQKFRDFSQNYPGMVGIITGDVSINPSGLVLIMTTEVFRNHLFRKIEKINKKEWIIFDEVHYIDDRERGTVWEEAIILLPPKMKILALSATIPNIDELVNWIRKIRKEKVKKVVEEKRPIPLLFSFQVNNAIYKDIKKLEKDIKAHSFSKPNRVIDLIKYLKNHNLLPAIYFCFSRRKCERLAFEQLRFDFLNDKERLNIINIFDHYVSKFKINEHISTKRIYPLIKKGIAYHHAGLLPPLKETIEQLFSQKLIKLLFTTETFALGVNMPSRTVCFDEIFKFYRQNFQYLRIRDFHQMAGRAGRRGIDKKGYIFVRLRANFEDIKILKRMLEGSPEAIRSQFNASYGTILNLYRDLGEDLVRIYPLTLRHFQSPHSAQRDISLITAKIELLKILKYIEDNSLTLKGEFASNIFGYEIISAELLEKGFFDSLSWQELAITVCAIVTEVRPGQKLPKLNKRIRKLKKELEHICSEIQHLEKKLRIFPRIKEPHFQLANALMAWLAGKKFNEIISYSYVDEGELIRNFRLAIQVLKDMEQPMIREKLKNKLKKAIDIMKREIVDAEWQLQV